MDDHCDTPRHAEPSRGEVFLSNLPYVVMIALGALVIWLSLRPSDWGWIGAGLYAAYGVLGPFWIILFLCPYCGRYGSSCPCGYGRIAAALRKRLDPSLFRRKFMRHISVIVPLWFVPLVAAGYVLAQASIASWPLLASLAGAFAVDGFLILPLAARRHGCGTCEQKADCPWMRRNGDRQGR